MDKEKPLEEQIIELQKKQSFIPILALLGITVIAGVTGLIIQAILIQIIGGCTLLASIILSYQYIINDIDIRLSKRTMDLIDYHSKKKNNL